MDCNKTTPNYIWVFEEFLSLADDTDIYLAVFTAPIGLIMCIFNNASIIIIGCVSKEFYRETSKSARIYYVGLAIGQLIAGTVGNLAKITSIIKLYLITSESICHSILSY